MFTDGRTSRRHWTALCLIGTTEILLGCNTRRDNQDYQSVDRVEKKEDTKLLSTDEMQRIFLRVERTILRLYSRPLPLRLPNWIAFHSILMYGNNAYDQYILGTGDRNLSRLFEVVLQSQSTKMGPYVIRNKVPHCRRFGPYFSTEHHPGQFLHYFGMAGGRPDARIHVDGVPFNVQKLIDSCMIESHVSGELTYLILGLSHYIEPQRVWKNKFGDEMSIVYLAEKLLDRNEAFCIGTHRLAAFARVFASALRFADRPSEILRRKLSSKLEESIVLLKASQDADGSFAPPGASPGSTLDGYQRLFYGGHSLEWIFELDKQLAYEPWVVSAVGYVAEAIANTFDNTYDMLNAVGDTNSHFDFDGLAHAVSAIRRWRDIVSRSKTPAL